MNSLDQYFLKETFNLAKLGVGIVSPNPMVGAIVVKDGIIVGRGYHRGSGTLHGEKEAILEAGENAKGSTLYVSLEPCCHYGRTPPCTDLIISSKIKKVVAPIKDPNPPVNGKGFKILEENGVEVVTGILKEEAEKLNAFYLKYIKTKKPYAILKAALTLDGRIGDPERNITKITSKESLKEVHRYRKKVDAILIGVGTILLDNPRLTVRLVESKHQPYKVVIDPNLRTPKDARIFKEGGKVILATLDKKAEEKYPEATIWTFKEKNGSIPVEEILKRAGEEKITSILIEGGSKTFTHFIKENAVDKYLLFYSPSFIGKGIPFLSTSLPRRFLNTRIKKIGEDILIEGDNVYGNN
ncbi:MAG: bifunctional diaminohydroxyphosphoribosylaminopyrimidine deaminase/5-amino-6-(5-phosphoribosylamino)uracil reductase RibD [candidate division WOR-3 bacterium]|nr:bifunctional diaminohydroxyphosphoribosylaminopyrimidine deaminase/5-amino-6-(5-phosphoribosylamino)uracil reductase RibD [candidate division WOR-3 bacterium]